MPRHPDSVIGEPCRQAIRWPSVFLQGCNHDDDEMLHNRLWDVDIARIE